jgi:hypothetical protein
MHYVFAMAGLAEAAIAEGLMVLGAGLVITVVLIIISLWRRSWVIGVIALVVCLGVGGFFEPWMSFSAKADPNDPDQDHWLFRCRLVAMIWLLCCVVGVASLAFIVRRRRLQSTT